MAKTMLKEEFFGFHRIRRHPRFFGIALPFYALSVIVWAYVGWSAITGYVIDYRVYEVNIALCFANLVTAIAALNKE